jgi:hypothetical protein
MHPLAPQSRRGKDVWVFQKKLRHRFPLNWDTIKVPASAGGGRAGPRAGTPGRLSYPGTNSI